MSNKVWLTSDLHFCHNREFLYGSRGFANTEEALENTVKRFNEVVSEEDTVWILGDCILNDNEKGIEALKQLKGHKHLVIGNHDTLARITLYKENEIFESIQYATMIKYKKYNFYLSHYPAITGNHDGTAPYNIHGHTHSKDKFCEFDGCYNVNQDAHNCYPVDMDTIILDIKKYNL